MAKSGHQIAQAENIDDAKHVVRCVNAFHDAGIDPADLPKFVEAVRIVHNITEIRSDGCAADVCRILTPAAACLPENKRGAE